MKDALPADDSAAPFPKEARARSAWAVVAAFGAYFCMYAFRKPFAYATYPDTELFGIGYKTVMVTAHVLGYMLSKFIGIKVVSEIRPGRRTLLLLVLVGVAEFALLMVALTPAPFNCIWMFVNGLPLGLVFGLILTFLEGRRQTEVLAAGLCTSFIVADGVMKSVGGYLCADLGVPVYWMPFTAGLLFVPLLGLFVWMLACVPAPSPQDIAARGARAPMNGAQRWRFFRAHGWGLSLLLIVFTLVTILRNVRGDFATEIWNGLGVPLDSGIFAQTESIVGVFVLIVCGSIVFVRGNRPAFFTALGVAIAGSLLVMLALAAQHGGAITPFQFIVLHGLGLYLPYIVVHTTIFERLLAMTRERGNIGYLMSLADAFGYLGFVGVLLAKNAVQPAANMLPFFVTLSWCIAAGCVVLLVPCWFYFARQSALQPEPEFLPATRMMLPLADAERTA